MTEIPEHQPANKTIPRRGETQKVDCVAGFPFFKTEKRSSEAAGQSDGWTDKIERRKIIR